MLVGKGLLNTKVYMCKTTFTLPYILGFVTYFVAFIFSILLWTLTAVQKCACLVRILFIYSLHLYTIVVIIVKNKFFIFWIIFLRKAKKLIY